MADSRVASRYVKSLLGLAVEQKAVLDKVHQDMNLAFQKCVQRKS
jgi:F-type H+-transporting ATPase subunit delta